MPIAIEDGDVAAAAIVKFNLAARHGQTHLIISLPEAVNASVLIILIINSRPRRRRRYSVERPETGDRRRFGHPFTPVTEWRIWHGGV